MLNIYYRLYKREITLKKTILKTLIAFITLAIVTSSFAEENSALSLLKDRLNGPVVGAHQGGLFKLIKHWPNTMPAFESALDSGATVIEMDLHLSKDGVVVIYHDPDLKIWTECKGAVHDRTLEELKACRFRFSRKAQIPTFEEVLSWSQGRIVINAEFKDFEAIKPAISLIQKHDAYSWVYFHTQGNREKYQIAHDFDPKVALTYAVHNADDLKWVLEQPKELLVVEVVPETRTESVISQIHAHGKLVTEDAWHFSKTHELFSSSCKKVFENKIDIAVSNRPKGCLKEKENL